MIGQKLVWGVKNVFLRRLYLNQDLTDVAQLAMQKIWEKRAFGREERGSKMRLQEIYRVLLIQHGFS